MSGVVTQNKTDIETSLGNLSGVVADNKTNLEISLGNLSGVVSGNKTDIEQSLDQVINDTNVRLLNLEDRDQVFTSVVVSSGESTSTSVSRGPGSVYVESEISSGGPLIVKDDTQSGFDSTSGSFTGSIVTDGGVGVAKNIQCGGEILSGGSLIVTNDTQSGFDPVSGSFTGSIVTSGGVGVTKNIQCGGEISSGGSLTVRDDTDTDSLFTGSIVTNGGLAVSKSVRCGGNVISPNISTLESDIKGSVLIGGIIMYSGTFNNGYPVVNGVVKFNWSLCDGAVRNGFQTPNLIDRFIKGGATSGTLGGANSYTLVANQLPNHTHAISHTDLKNALNHTHSLNINVGARSDYADGAKNGLYQPNPASIPNTSLVNSWSSNVNVNTMNMTHTQAPIDNQPLFYTLAFIIRIE